MSEKREFILLGPPGAGKGTQAMLMSKKFSLAHISTGEMLRNAVSAGAELGRRVSSIIDSGELVPDELMIELIRERIKEADCEKGYILDGFPRTVKQAEALGLIFEESQEELPKVLFFDVDCASLGARLEHRRASESRKDDVSEVQQERLRVYRENTAPLIEFYEKLGLLCRVSGEGTIEDVQSRVEDIVANL